ncbi:unnamed protein product [marine sediment metagenome]|uniref:Uncharacterized protein n=1 Tax=marine sediment metagenome TaxID=412755 RepID=X1D163_9ZZZZ
MSVIEALQESEEAKQKISCGLTDSGIMTANEVRDKFYQMDTVPGGDKRTIRGKYVVVEDTGKPEGNENPDDNENPEDESPGDGEDVGDGDNFDFSKAELEDLIVSLRKRFKKRIKES